MNMNITALPKVLLHDHLDGGLRPRTVIELADEYGYGNLPTHDVDELAAWFNRGAKRNDLVLYLETFAHTVGVMQHRDAIERVAYECAVDLAADGVVYAEVRMAPELCTEQGLTLDEVVQAIIDVLARRDPELAKRATRSLLERAPSSADLVEQRTLWEPLMQVYPDLLPARDRHGCAFLRAAWPRVPARVPWCPWRRPPATARSCCCRTDPA